MANITIQLKRNFLGPDGNRYRAEVHGRPIQHDLPQEWFERADPEDPKKRVLILPTGAKIIDRLDPEEKAADPTAVIEDLKKEVGALRKELDLIRQPKTKLDA